MNRNIALLIGMSGLAFAAIAEADAPNSGQKAAASPRGAAVYGQCSACHGRSLEGAAFGPALKGRAFAAKWKGNMKGLRQLISTTMPMSTPGSLSVADAIAVTDFIAAANGGFGPISTGRADQGDLAQGPVSVPAIHNGTLKTESASAMGVGPQASAPEVFRDVTYERREDAKRKQLAALSEVTPNVLKRPPASDWLGWRRTQDGGGFSPLSQINRRNAKHLTLKWAWSLPAGTNQIAPIVHEGVMFVQSAREVQALDAATGDLLWRFKREVAEEFRGPVNGTQRNFAILGDKIFVATADRHLIALDFRTGQQVWDHVVVEPETAGVLTSAGPFVAGNVLMQGVSMGPGCHKGCSVIGLDPQTGRRLWTFNTVARPGEPGGDSWNDTPLEERSGGAVWIAGTYDPDLDIAYFGTGGTYGISRLLLPTKDGKISKNDALYTNSTIALKPSTGTLVWAHQHFPREMWDLDEVFERTLVDLPVNGKLRKLAVTIGKVGILDAMDRETGEYLFSKDFKLSNIVTAIDAKTGARSINPASILAPGKAVDICPSAEGARNWMATAFNPQTRVLYVPMQETCMKMSWVEHEDDSPAKGRLDIGWSLKPPSGSDGKYGRLEAVDLVTGKTLWMKRDRHIPSSSMLSTGGGLLFSGNADRWFRALDDRNGNVLWESRLSAVPNATPITFSVAGKQYVAIAAGGGGAHDVDTVELTPEMPRSTHATTLLVFSLQRD